MGVHKCAAGRNQRGGPAGAGLAGRGKRGARGRRERGAPGRGGVGRSAFDHLIPQERTERAEQTGDSGDAALGVAPARGGGARRAGAQRVGRAGGAGARARRAVGGARLGVAARASRRPRGGASGVDQHHCFRRAPTLWGLQVHAMCESNAWGVFISAVKGLQRPRLGGEAVPPRLWPGPGTIASRPCGRPATLLPGCACFCEAQAGESISDGGWQTGGAVCVGKRGEGWRRMFVVARQRWAWVMRARAPAQEAPAAAPAAARGASGRASAARASVKVGQRLGTGPA